MRWDTKENWIIEIILHCKRGQRTGYILKLVKQFKMFIYRTIV